MSIRCYSELIQLPTFMDRYQYLRLDGVVGEETFGFDRYMNQAFYKSPEWRLFVAADPVEPTSGKEELQSGA